MNRLWICLLIVCAIMASLLVTTGCDDDDDDAQSDDDTDDDADDDTTDDDNGDDDAVDDDSVDDDLGFIVAAQFTDQGSNLVRFDQPGTAPTVLVSGPGHIVVYPTISPDGQLIAFASNLHDPNPGVNFATMLYLMTADGGEMALVTNDSYLQTTESEPAFSPDGARLAYIRSSSIDPPVNLDRIYLVDIDGSNQQALYDDVESRNDYEPSFSLDGQYLVYVSDGDVLCGDIYLADLSQNPPSRVRLTTSDPLQVVFNSDPFFDAAGEWVYFESQRNDSFGLYRVPVAGGEPQLVWDIGYSEDGPYEGMYAYSQLRPTPDVTGLVGTGALNGTDRVVVIPDLTPPLAQPIPVSGVNLDVVEPYWWRPAAR